MKEYIDKAEIINAGNPERHVNNIIVMKNETVYYCHYYVQHLASTNILLIRIVDHNGIKFDKKMDDIDTVIHMISPQLQQKIRNEYEVEDGFKIDNAITDEIENSEAEFVFQLDGTNEMDNTMFG